MIVTPIRTDKILPGKLGIFEVLDKSLLEFQDQSILAVTSKIVSLCEGRFVSINGANKDRLVIQESDYYLPRKSSKYEIPFTITKNTLIPAAGIDESNTNGNYLLWPSDPQKTANEIRSYLKKRFGVKDVGVIITDSTAMPLHWGTTGIAIRHSGFSATNDYIGKPDLFDRPFKVSKANVLDGLAAAAVVAMGEGTEQTPLAIIEDIPFVEFQDRNPTKKELDGFYITHLTDDLFEPFLKDQDWQKGGGGKKT